MTDPSQAIVDALTQLGLDTRRDPAGIWTTVPCTSRTSLAVLIVVAERSATLRTFVMRAPDTRHEAVYRRVLRKNSEAGVWAFALDEPGDVFLVAQRPLALLDADGLDGVLGALSALADETFDGLVRLGFDIPPDVSMTPPSPSGE